MGLLNRQRGFTMAEVLVALLVSAIVLGAIFVAFSSQHKSYLVQDDTAEMQQSLRATMDFMVREIQMAGFDPEQTGNFGFQNLAGIGDPDYGRYTGEDGISFIADIDMNGLLEDSSTEQVAYGLDLREIDGAKLVDLGEDRDFVLRKFHIDPVTGSASWQPLTDNIEALEFFYTLANGTTTLNPTAAQLSLIRTVQLTILARSPQADASHMDRKIYTSPGGVDWGPYNDDLRRRLLSRTILCRNMGLPVQL
jgi:type IV pilus assembly protein PilW